MGEVRLSKIPGAEAANMAIFASGEGIRANGSG